MKYVSIDIETTGLDFNKCQVIEISAIVDFLGNKTPIEQLPTFNKVVIHDTYYFEKIAMEMHKKSGLLDILLDPNPLDGNIIKSENLFIPFNSFILTNYGGQKVVAAGKNFGSFDKQFLNPYGFKFLHRSLDPTVFYVKADDIVPPDLAECLKRANLEPIDVAHRSLGDAQAIVRLVRHGYSRLS